MNIKQKIYVASGLIVVIVVLLAWGIVKPLIREIKSTSVLVRESNEKLSTLERTNQTYLEGLESDYKEAEGNISLIKDSFLTKEQAVDFFVSLENIASSTSNQLKIEANEFPNFTLHLLGDFPNLMKFLGWLENSKYFLDVYSLQIKQFTEKTSLQEEAVPAGTITTTLKLKAHTQETKAYEEEKNLKSD